MTMTQPSATTLDLDSETPKSLLFSDLDGELKTTRKLLERVPDGNDDWQPHAKSMKIGALASHLAQLSGYGTMILTTDDFDGSTMKSAPAFTKNADRLKFFDEQAAQFKELLSKMTWEQARATWKFRFGDRPITSGPRANLIRTMVITHSTHHRAQLGVYLRLLGIAIPGSYGPSADEPFGAPK